MNSIRQLFVVRPFFQRLIGLCCGIIFFQNLSHAQINRAVFENLLAELESQALNVNAIVQDHNGFMWFGTDEGLIRYDGISYQYYLPKIDDLFAISDKRVNTLCLDVYGNLWIATRNGLNRYDYLHNRFEKFFHNPADSTSLTDNEVYSLCGDKNGNLWIGTLSGLNKIKIDSRESSGDAHERYSFQRFLNNSKNQHSLSNNAVWTIATDSLHNIWVGTDDGLNLLSQGADGKITFTRFINDLSDEYSISKNSILKIYCDKKGNLWFIAKSGMLDMLDTQQLNNHSFRFQHFLPPLKDKTSADLNTNAFLIDQKNNCWLGTVDDGLIRFTVSDGKINVREHFRNIPSNTRSLLNNSIWSIYDDPSGIVWIGTNGGISKYNYESEKFSVINIVSPSYNFEEKTVSALTAENGHTIWIGEVNDTVCSLSGGGEECLKFTLAPPADYQAVSSILVSNNGDLYIGTNHGLYIVRKEEKDKLLNRKIKSPAFQYLLHRTGDTGSICSNSIQCIIQDKSGKVWVGTGKGLNVIDPNNLHCSTLLANKNRDQINPSYIIRHIVQTQDGHMWIATDGGLYDMDPATGKYRVLTYHGDTLSLPDNAISYIHENKKGTLWLGTGKGLCSYDRSTGHFRLHALPVANSFLNILGILEDEDGNLWISSNQGIFKMNKNGVVSSYTTKNGLYANRFTLSCAAECSDGLFIFGGEKGFTSFYPDSIASNKAKPPVVITDFKLFDQSILTGRYATMVHDFLANRTIKLNYNQNFFTIDFAALNFINAEANNYAYQLVGVDNDWVSAGNRRTATYTNVEPANYIFKVKGSNNDGVWNNQATLLHITITPPWWKTWWFYLLCLIAFASILYAIYQYRINQIKKLFMIRSKIARDLHDDIGSTLSSISLMSQVAKDRIEDKEKEQELFNTISSASKEAMELMSVIVWSVNPNNDKLGNILVKMREYASDMLEAANIEFNIQVDEDVKEVVIPMEKRKDFYLIFKEAVNNVAKYSGAQQALIRLFMERGRLQMVIDDDGEGFDVQKLRSGNGLVNMRARAEFIGGRLDIKSEFKKGTSVYLDVPLSS